MADLVDFNRSISNLDISALSKTVGFLVLANHYYPIVIPENYPENNENHKSVREVSCFELNEKQYLILSIDLLSKTVDRDPVTTLSEREKQIALLVALGQQNKQIVNQLNISEWTVSTHLRRIFTKLGVESRAAMVYRCFTSEWNSLKQQQIN